MIERKYLFPGVIELNFQAGRPLGVNIYLIDGGTEWVLIDVGQEDTLDEIIELVRALDFQLSKCKMLIATHADADHVQALAKARERLRGEDGGPPARRGAPGGRATRSRPTPASRHRTSTSRCRPARSTSCSTRATRSRSASSS